MPSTRQAWAIFLGVTVAVAIIVVAFVHPGQAPVPCSADTWVPNNTIPITGGHWYCSETVVPRLTEVCGPGISEINGTPVIANFYGYLFSVHLFSYCIGYSQLGLNASVVRPSGSVFNVTVLRGGAFWEGWYNWTSPQNDTGFQWRPNLGPHVPRGTAGNVSLLIAPK